jgi:hypothetical protein
LIVNISFFFSFFVLFCFGFCFPFFHWLYTGIWSLRRSKGAVVGRFGAGILENVISIGMTRTRVF